MTTATPRPARAAQPASAAVPAAPLLVRAAFHALVVPAPIGAGHLLHPRPATACPCPECGTEPARGFRK